MLLSFQKKLIGGFEICHHDLRHLHHLRNASKLLKNAGKRKIHLPPLEIALPYDSKGGWRVRAAPYFIRDLYD